MKRILKFALPVVLTLGLSAHAQTHRFPYEDAGLESQLPATCTVPQQYLATDTNQKWECFGTVGSAGSWARPGSSYVDVRNYIAGPIKQANVATTVSCTSGSGTLTSSTALWSAADVGKKFVIDGCGSTSHGANLSVGGTITGFTSSTSITTDQSANITNTQNPATRFAWGTDYTTQFDNAIQACGSTTSSTDGGCDLHIPAGHYFVQWMNFPCGGLSTTDVAAGCTKFWKNTHLIGAGEYTTIIENWNPLPSYPANTIGGNGYGLIIVGGVPWQIGGATAVSGFVVSDLTALQTRGSLNIPANINFGGVVHSIIERTHTEDFQGLCLLDNLGQVSHHNTIRYNDVGPCGNGGTGFTGGPITTASTFTNIYGNYIHDGPQGYEGTGHDTTFRDNLIDMRGVGATQSPCIGINAGSTTLGAYNFTVSGNTVYGASALGCQGITLSSGISNYDRSNVTNNTFINTVNNDLGSGSDADSVAHRGGDTVLHATSFSSNNKWLFDCSVDYTGQQTTVLNIDGQTENWVSTGDTIQFPCNANASSTLLTIGNQNGAGTLVGSGASPAAWTADTAQGATTGTGTITGMNIIEPTNPNGYWYAAIACVSTCHTSATTEPTWPTTVCKPDGTGSTVVDNNVTWQCMGRKAKHTIKDLTLVLPAGLVNPFNIITTNKALADSFTLSNIVANQDWDFTPGVTTLSSYPNGGGDDYAWYGYSTLAIRAGEPFSASNFPTWTDSGVPTGGFFSAKSIVTKYTPTAGAGGMGWQVSPGGWVAKAWVANHAYTFNRIVIDTPGGHVFQQRTIAGCTSLNPGPPTWNTTIGTTTADSTCSWLNVGVAATFLARP